MKNNKPGKMKITGGLVRTIDGKRTASIEVDLYRVMGVAFTPKNSNWNPTLPYNEVFLRSTIEYLSQKLQAQSYLFLNDALGDLGFEREPAGQVIGWHIEEGPLNITFKTRNDQIWIELVVHGVIVNRI